MSTHPRPEGRTEARQKVVQRANRIKLSQRRGFPKWDSKRRRWVLGVVGFETRPFNMRQVDQAVCLIRRRGTAADRKLLAAAGYRASRGVREEAAA